MLYTDIEIEVFAFQLGIRVAIFFKDIDHSDRLEIITAFEHRDIIDKLFHDDVVVASQDDVDVWCLEWEFLVLRDSHVRKSDHNVAAIVLP